MTLCTRPNSVEHFWKNILRTDGGRRTDVLTLSLLELLSQLKTKCQFSIFSTLTMVEIEISNLNHLIKPSLTYLNIIGPSAPDPNPVEHFWKNILRRTEDGRTDGVTSSLLELLSQPSCYSIRVKDFSWFEVNLLVEFQPSRLTRTQLTCVVNPI